MKGYIVSVSKDYQEALSVLGEVYKPKLIDNYLFLRTEHSEQEIMKIDGVTAVEKLGTFHL